MSLNQKLILCFVFVFFLGISWGWNLRALDKNPGIAVTKWVFQTSTAMRKLVK